MVDHSKRPSKIKSADGLQVMSFTFIVTLCVLVRKPKFCDSFKS